MMPTAHGAEESVLLSAWQAASDRFCARLACSAGLFASAGRTAAAAAGHGPTIRAGGPAISLGGFLGAGS